MHSFQAVTMGYVFGAWTCLGGEICPWQRWEENVAPGPKQAERGARRLLVALAVCSRFVPMNRF